MIDLDLKLLRELIVSLLFFASSYRALYLALTALTFALSGIIGPLLGAALAEKGQWRWIFYRELIYSVKGENFSPDSKAVYWLGTFIVNLPIIALTSILMLLRLHIKVPKTTWQEKIDLIDWYNCISVTSFAWVKIFF